MYKFTLGVYFETNEEEKFIISFNADSIGQALKIVDDIYKEYTEENQNSILSKIIKIEHI